MSEQMQRFLKLAAECEEGKGLLLNHDDERIADVAASEGFGTTLTFGNLSMFTINKRGRAVVERAAS